MISQDNIYGFLQLYGIKEETGGLQRKIVATTPLLCKWASCFSVYCVWFLTVKLLFI